MARRTGRDPVSGRAMLDGITAITSDRTGAITYQARWSWTSPLGERLFGAKIFKDLFAAEQHLLQTQLSIRRGDWGPADTTTLDEYAGRWLDRMAHTWASSTLYMRRRSYQSKIAPFLGRVRITAITRAQCQAIVDELNGQGHRPATVHVHVATLAGVLESAAQDGLIARNPASRLTLPAVRRHEPEIWTAMQIRHFITVTWGTKYSILWLFLLLTAVRVGEALALSWRDVDLERGTVRIRSTLRTMADGSVAVAAGTKTGTHRTIPIPPALVDILRDHQRQQRSRPGALIDIQAYVFASATGKHWSRGTIRAARDAAAKRAGLPPFDPRIRNPFRHMAATLLAEQGEHLGVAQAILGHANPSMTLRQYTHLTGRDAVARLADAIMESRATTSVPETPETGEAV